MATTTLRSSAVVDDDDKPVLPWPYVTILVAEATALATLAIMFPGHPPFAYELGWAGAASMAVMQLYSIRRRVGLFGKLGSLRTWLDAHIFLGFQGFVFVAYHSVGITMNTSIAAANFALVALVVCTGVLGRYLYGLIPRARAGRAAAYAEVATALGDGALPPALRRECRGLLDLIVLDFARHKALRALRRGPAVSPSQARALRRSIDLASSISALEVAERWFSRWSLFHRPVAFLLAGITTLHVLAHFAYAT